MTSKYLHMNPFLSSDDAESMMSIAQSFGSFGTYADEGTSDSLGEELPQRFDVGINYFDQGLDGAGNSDTPEVAEFRGANRKLLPQWLLVVMLHSGLFER